MISIIVTRLPIVNYKAPSTRSENHNKFSFATCQPNCIDILTVIRNFIFITKIYKSSRQVLYLVGIYFIKVTCFKLEFVIENLCGVSVLFNLNIS